MKSFFIPIHILFPIAICALFLPAAPSLAAVLSVDPVSPQSAIAVRTSDQFAIDVMLDTEGEAINAFSGDVVYNPELLKLVSVSIENSVIDVWVARPHEEHPGVVDMSGIIPGGFVGVRSAFYTGTKPGRIARLVFEAKTEARTEAATDQSQVQPQSRRTSISLNDVTALLHDGNGTPARVRTVSYTFSIIPSILMSSKIVFTDPSLQPMQQKTSDFFAKIDRSDIIEGGKWFAVFDSTDMPGGIDHYEVNESQDMSPTILTKFAWNKAASPYILQDQSRRSYVHIRAVSKDGHEKVTTIAPLDDSRPGHLSLLWGILIVMIVLGISIALKKWKGGFLSVGLLIAFMIAVSPSPIHAADLTMYPSSGTFPVDKPFTVDVMIDNNAGPINAISGSISFPNNILNIASFDKSQSIIKIWTQEPTFSNAKGTIYFEGIIFNPGYAQAKGKILSIQFTPKRSGQAALSYTSGSILANDGKGTNVLQMLGTASFNMSTGDQSGVSTTPSLDPFAPPAPKISSASYPDTNHWYNKTSGTFSWEIPTDVTAVRIGYDKYSISSPTVTYRPAISSKTIENLADGVYYIHVQLQNSHGWGATSHYRFQVDTVPPVPFKITFPHGTVADNPQPIIYFNTPDLLSGIDHYEVKIGDKALLSYAPEALSNPYAMPIQAPGNRTVLVRAIDKAGNSTTESADFTIEPIPVPVITNYPTELTVTDIFKVRGMTYPNASVDFFLRNDKGNIISTDYTKSNSLGDFAVVWSKKLDAGVYQLTAQVTDDRGAKSAETEPVTITFDEEIFVHFGRIALNFVSLVILVILAIAIVAAALYILYRMLFAMKRRVARDLTDAEAVFHQEIHSLKDDIREQLHMLEHAGSRRELTKEEANLIKVLNKRIDATESILASKLDKIKRDVR